MLRRWRQSGRAQKASVVVLSGSVVAITAYVVHVVGDSQTLPKAEQDRVNPKLVHYSEKADLSLKVRNVGGETAYFKRLRFYFDEKCIDSEDSVHWPIESVKAKLKFQSSLYYQIFADLPWKSPPEVGFEFQIPGAGFFIEPGKGLTVFSLAKADVSSFNRELDKLAPATRSNALDRFSQKARSVPMVVEYCSDTWTFCRGLDPAGLSDRICQ